MEQNRNVEEMGIPFAGKRAADTLFWALDEQGVLTVGGSGSMPDYECGMNPVPAPWREEKAQIRAVRLSPEVSDIGANAFRGCENLRTVGLHKGQYVHYCAFEGCRALEEVEGAENLTFVHVYDPERLLKAARSKEQGLQRGGHEVILGLHAFSGTPWAIRSWGDYFRKEGLLLDVLREEEEVVIPEGVQEIGMFAFSRMPLRSLKLPEGLEEIGIFAFEHTSLTELSLPASLKEVGSGAFSFARELCEVRLPQLGWKESWKMDIAEDAFAGTKLKFTRGRGWYKKELYGLALKKEKGIEGFKRLFVEHKRNQVGSATLDVGESLLRKMRKDTLLLCIEYDTETKLVKRLKSFASYPIREYLMYPCCEEDDDGNPVGDAEIWQDSVTYLELDDVLCSFGGDPKKLMDEELIRDYADGRTREDWYWSNDVGNFSGPAELELLRQWMKKHPQYRVQTKEENREEEMYRIFVDV